MLRRILIALVVVVCLSGAAVGWLWWHQQPKPQGNAYVGVGDVPLWDGTGQVRRRLAQLSYGDTVVILDRYRNSVEVRTIGGMIGWVDESGLILPDLWNRVKQLDARTRTMPVQARGHMAYLANLRIDPGRVSQRIGQLTKGTSVEVLARGVAEWGGEVNPASGRTAGGRKEDWLLVRTQVRGIGAISGWLLGRFVSYDLPDPLPQYATSEGLRPVAWFELKKVNDPSSGPKPYYLMVGTRSPEGLPCDFTVVLVYTWSHAHQRYETAYVENNLCGKIPVTIETLANQDVLFHFRNLDSVGDELLTYRMRSTIVRRVRQHAPAPARRHYRR